MKKKILAISLFCIFLSGCKNSLEIEYDTIENISSNFVYDFEKCKSSNYANLNFSDCSLLLPKVDTLMNLDITVRQESITSGKMLNDFEKYCMFFLNSYDSENALFSSSSQSIAYNQDEDYGKYAWYPKVDNYKEKIKNNAIDVDAFLYRDIDNDKYLWWNFASMFPHWISKGKAYSFIKNDDSKISSWIPSDMGNKTASYYNDGKYDDRVYHLLDGDMSIGEAVTYFENSYLNSLPYELDDNYSLDVFRTDVYNISENLFCYVFNFSSAWKGVPFDSREETFSYQDTSHNFMVSGEALMINRNEIDTIVDLSFPIIQEAKLEIEKICSLEDAVNIMSNNLTNAVKFDVKTIELVYRGKYTKDYTMAHLEPSWKFLTYNSNDTLYYCIYVNVVDGTCEYESFVPLEELN